MIPRATRWSVAALVSVGVHEAVLWSLPAPPARPVLEDWGASVLVEAPDVVWITEPPRDAEPEVPAVVPPPEVPAVVRAAELAPADSVAGPPDPAPTADPAPAVQGLSDAAFAEGPGGPPLRAGTTLRVAATTAPLDVPVPTAALNYSDAPRPPRCRPPRIEVPAAVIEARLQGDVALRFTVGADGAVRDVRVVRSLTPEADAACVAAWSNVVCTPAMSDGVPVTVVEMPYSCRFMELDR
jgi:TonB family protein